MRVVAFDPDSPANAVAIRALARVDLVACLTPPARAEGRAAFLADLLTYAGPNEVH